MDNSKQFWRWSAIDIARSVRSREVSAREVTLSCLERLDAVNPIVNAVVEVRAEEALASADAADAAVKQGAAVGILHGVPITTKLNVDQAGSATSNGVVALQNNVASGDSAVVANLRREGAIILGRTNVPAFSWRWFTDNALHGRTRNPWQNDVACGGSSGGAAVAVATGIGPIAHGSDLAGSIRYPAYACGVFGMRPTFGLVPQYDPGAVAERPLLSQLFVSQGPLARTVADIKLSLQAMARPDPRDPWCVPVPVDLQPVGPCKVALFNRFGNEACDPAVTLALGRAALALEAAGYVVEEVEPPRFSELTEVYYGAITEARNGFFKRIDDLGDPSIRQVARSLDAVAERHDLAGYISLLSRRTALLREWQVFLEKYPLLVMPVSWNKPFPNDLDLGGDAAVARIIRSLGPTIAVNVLGLPAMAMPIGGAEGIPSGVQLVSGKFREAVCLSAGEIIERACPLGLPIDPR